MNDVRQDITLLKSDQLRKCAAHSGANCDLPRELDSFGAGFSCTSYSLLNTQATQNASAMDRMTKHGIAPDDPEEFWPKEMTLIYCPFFWQPRVVRQDHGPWAMGQRLSRGHSGLLFPRWQVYQPLQDALTYWTAVVQYGLCLRT